MKTFRYELFQWLDMANLSPVYGVRLHEGGKRYYMGERGKPCLSYNQDEALMFMDFRVPPPKRSFCIGSSDGKAKART